MGGQKLQHYLAGLFSLPMDVSFEKKTPFFPIDIGL